MKRGAAVCGGLLALVLMTGCGPLYYADPNPDSPFVFPGQELGAAGPTDVPTGGGTVSSSSVLRVGDTVNITYSDIPQPGIPESRMRIGEDGKITLPFNVIVQAAGKTARQLEQEIRSEYVPRYFKYLTVTVNSESRFYFVGGEVKAPSRQPHMGEITVLRAIDTAGGFSDFANRKKIELRRANGQIHVINWEKAKKDPTLDLPVYPNDQVTVPRRFW